MYTDLGLFAGVAGFSAGWCLDIISTASKGRKCAERKTFLIVFLRAGAAPATATEWILCGEGGRIDVERQPKLPCNSDGTQCSQRYVQWLND